jgi:bacteriocin biosynthesis cyclodehydratase domain-containing protein
MLERPTFSPQYHVEVVEPEGVYLLSERGHTVLKGAVHCRLAPLLDGGHTADAIVERLVDEGRVNPAEVYYALGLLERKGYAVEADGVIPVEQAAFWRGLGLDPMEVTRRLRASRVALAAYGDVPTVPLVAALDGLDVRIVEAGDEADLTVALADDYLREGLDRLNAAALAGGRPWLLAKPLGSVPWIGPLFRPGTTGCWACLAQRLRSNGEVEGYLQRRLGVAGPLAPSHAALPTGLRAATEFTATQVALWLARGAHPELEGRVISLNVIGLEAQGHTLVRQPQCPACGDPTVCSRRRQVALESRRKAFTADGGHREVTPEQTIARYEHHVSPITGAVASIVRLPTDADHFLQVYMAGHNFAYRQLSLAFLKKGLRSKAAGKGKSEAQARASALCEAIERYSGMFRGDEPRRTASYRQLGDEAIHPNAHLLFSEPEYAERAAWNARGSSFQVVSDPLDEDVQIEWTPLWSLTHQAFKYLPTASCYYSYPSPPGQFFSWADSNGNAAGNNLEEAILQGFLELVERDSVALWWYNRIPRPAVELAGFDEPYFLELRERYARLDRELWVLDITSDPGYPDVRGRLAADGQAGRGHPVLIRHPPRPADRDPAGVDRDEPVPAGGLADPARRQRRVRVRRPGQPPLVEDGDHCRAPVPAAGRRAPAPVRRRLPAAVDRRRPRRRAVVPGDRRGPGPRDAGAGPDPPRLAVASGQGGRAGDAALLGAVWPGAAVRCAGCARLA